MNFAVYTYYYIIVNYLKQKESQILLKVIQKITYVDWAYRPGNKSFHF